MSEILRKLFRVFRRDERGTVAVMFAPISLMLIVSVGAAVDYTSIASTRSTVQDVVDAMALASTRGLLISEAEARREARRVFDSNIDELPDIVNASFNQNSDLDLTDTVQSRAVQATVHVQVNTFFSGVLSLNQVNFDVVSRSEINDSKTEIVLVLDVSGSMRGTKIATLRTAAADFMSIIFGERATSDTLRVSVIPYSGNVRFPANYISWLNRDTENRNNFTGCFQPMGARREVFSGANDPDEIGRQQMSLFSGIGDMRRDFLDNDNRFFPSFPRSHGAFQGNPARPNNDGNCLRRPENTILAFSNNRDALIRHVRGLNTEGLTATDLAMSWARRFTHQSWRGRFLETVQYPENRDETNKIVILMTDGQINHGSNNANRAGHGYSNGQANNFFNTLCSAIKIDGPEIYTIGYDIRNGQVLGQLQACATTTTEHYFNPTVANLRGAFEAIAQSITELRLTN